MELTQNVSAIVGHFVDRAADRRRNVRPVRVHRVDGDQARIEECHGRRQVHGGHKVHRVAAVVDGQIGTAGERVVLQQTRDVQRKQLETLGKDQLSGGCRRCAMFAVAGEDLRRAVHQIILEDFRSVFEELRDALRRKRASDGT